MDDGLIHDVFIIAEAGVNHNGSVDMAVRLIESAAACGADCVKFQTFKAEHVASKDAPKARYQLKTSDKNESQLSMLKTLELPKDAWPRLFRACKENGVMFLSTPYSMQDIDFLDRLGVSAYKVASGQIVELAFLREVASKGKAVILSTGMATLAEVDEAVRTIRTCSRYGRIAEAALAPLTVLQCTTDYPSRLEDANLLAMRTMGLALQVPVGYSDHTEGEIAAVVAVSLGATIIEKHFTLDRSLPGPDQAASSDPPAFKRLVEAIRCARVALGHGRKEPSARELENRQNMRRGVVCARNMAEGTKLEMKDIAFKRPCYGIPPNRIDMVLGKELITEVKDGEFIDVFPGRRR
ncbi:MAG: N-acetylneuraminate synthase [Deltaproteobacteria bacterium]|nr:N-acetylneuraminate synthase [Deltaproteobacteria bacterium]